MATGTYDAVLMLGSGGSGKTVAGRAMHDLAKDHFGADRAARCANSGRIAATVGCDTFAHRFHYGSRKEGAPRPYGMNTSNAIDVADVKCLIVEEVTAMPNRLAEKHLAAYRDAKVTVNAEVQDADEEPRYHDLGRPLYGLKLIASGDPLQQIACPPGVARIKPGEQRNNFADRGEAVASVPAANEGKRVWDLPSLQHADAKVLVLVFHGNHRLLGVMLEANSTGCDTNAVDGWLCSCCDHCRELCSRGGTLGVTSA